MTAAAVVDQVPELRARREATPRAARHGWATHAVVMVANSAGDLVPEVPGELYAGIATWRSQRTWREAFHAHPRLVEAARRYETCSARVHQVMELAATYADPATGRGIAVAHRTLARKLGVTSKVIQRCFWAAEDLGLLERVLDGSDMTLKMRMQVRDHYPHGTRRGSRSKLANVYAATLPRWLATRLPGHRPKPVRGVTFAGVSVDNLRRASPLNFGNVYPPVGGTPEPEFRLSLVLPTTTFETSRGQPDVSNQQAHRTAAARPTKAHRRTGSERAPRRLDPAVERFARALRHDLLGFRSVSLYRICPGLSLYVSAGLSVSDLRRGLDDYLAAVGRTWLTSWRPDQAEEQARYLIGMLNRARLAGYIRLPVDDDTGEWW